MSFVRALKQNPSKSNNHNKIPPAVDPSYLPLRLAALALCALAKVQKAIGSEQRRFLLPLPEML